MAMNDDSRFNADGLVLSARYGETMETAVLPFLSDRCVKTVVPGYENRPIACRRYAADNPRGTALVLHGFTENACKYSELIHSLLRSGFSALSYDQRGHGGSWRREDLPDTSLTHVDDFEEYVKDMEIVCDRLMKDMPKPYFIFAHSMGGAVAALYLERHPDVFSKAALCAPMIAPNTYGISPALVGLVCRGAKLIGHGTRRPPMSKPYSGPEDFETSCATGRERFDWYDRVKFEHPEYQNSNPSYGWTLEALGVTKKLLAPGAPERIACPVRLYGAETDNSVMPEPQKAFIARVKGGVRTVVPGSKHEIYRSPDAVLFPWWHGILEFFGE